MRDHRFIASDPGMRKILLFNEKGEITKQIPTLDCCYNVWNMGNDRYLYSHFSNGTDGVSIIDSDGNVQFQYLTKGEVFGCQPLDNGNILVAELITKRLVEVTPTGEIAVEIPVFYNGDLPHECMRGVRKAGGNYYLMQPGLNRISVFDQDGRKIRSIPTYHDTFGLFIKDNGNVVYSYMDGIVEVDPEGKEVWHLTDKDVPGIDIRWILEIHPTQDGIMACNWLGHGHNEEGVPFFEVNQDKEVIWKCDCRYETNVPASFDFWKD